MNGLTDKEKRYVSALYYAFKTDAQIARQAHVSRASIAAWRHACGLPENTPFKEKPKKKK